MEVAKEILAINSRQRIIFASAYVNDILMEVVQQLKQPVELLQKTVCTRCIDRNYR